MGMASTFSPPIYIYSYCLRRVPPPSERLSALLQYKRCSPVSTGGCIHQHGALPVLTRHRRCQKLPLSPPSLPPSLPPCGLQVWFHPLWLRPSTPRVLPDNWLRFGQPFARRGYWKIPAASSLHSRNGRRLSFTCTVGEWGRQGRRAGAAGTGTQPISEDPGSCMSTSWRIIHVSLKLGYPAASRIIYDVLAVRNTARSSKLVRWQACSSIGPIPADGDTLKECVEKSKVSHFRPDLSTCKFNHHRPLTAETSSSGDNVFVRPLSSPSNATPGKENTYCSPSHYCYEIFPFIIVLVLFIARHEQEHCRSLVCTLLVIISYGWESSYKFHREKKNGDWRREIISGTSILLRR